MFHYTWRAGILGKFDWGVRYVIIFLYVKFWIRLAAVSCRGKKVRTVASPAVRSVNKSRDTRNRVLNESEYAICVIVTTRLYYKVLGLIMRGLIWQIRHNYKRLDDGHFVATGLRKMSVLGMAGAMVTTHEILWWCDRFRDQNCFAICKTYWKWKRVMGFTLWCCL